MSEKIRYRLLYVSPWMAAFLGGFITLCLDFGALILGDIFGDESSEHAELWLRALGGATGTFLALWLFNLIAPVIGGLQIWIHFDPGKRVATKAKKEPAGGKAALDLLAPLEGTAQKRECPSCGASVRKDLSFCPECGHEFEVSPTDNDS